jgi:hypothetical protein
MDSSKIQIEVSLNGDGVELRSIINDTIMREEWIPRSISENEKIKLAITSYETYFQVC